MQANLQFFYHVPGLSLSCYFVLSEFIVPVLWIVVGVNLFLFHVLIIIQCKRNQFINPFASVEFEESRVNVRLRKSLSLKSQSSCCDVMRV